MNFGKFLLLVAVYGLGSEATDKTCVCLNHQKQNVGDATERCCNYAQKADLGRAYVPSSRKCRFDRMNQWPFASCCESYVAQSSCLE